MTCEDIFKDTEGRAKTECYEIVKYRDRARMLTFIMRDNSFYSGSYSHMHGVRLLGDTLKIEFSEAMAVVEGEELEMLYRPVTDHRVVYLREVSDSNLHMRLSGRIKGISIIDR